MFYVFEYFEEELGQLNKVVYLCNEFENHVFKPLTKGEYVTAFCRWGRLETIVEEPFRSNIDIKIQVIIDTDYETIEEEEEYRELLRQLLKEMKGYISYLINKFQQMGSVNNEISNE